VIDAVAAEDQQGWEPAVRSLEEQMRSAFLERDVQSLDRLWSDEFTVNSPLNVVTPKRGVLAALESHRMAIARHANIVPQPGT
jgi:hypothetical protein